MGTMQVTINKQVLRQVLGAIPVTGTASASSSSGDVPEELPPAVQLQVTDARRLRIRYARAPFRVEAELTATADGTGTADLELVPLRSCIAHTDAVDITITQLPRGYHVHLGDTTVALSSREVPAYPDVKAPGTDLGCIEVDATALRRALSHVSRIANATGNNTSQRRRILLAVGKDCLVLAATDGHRIHSATLDCDTRSELPVTEFHSVVAAGLLSAIKNLGVDTVRIRYPRPSAPVGYLLFELSNDPVQFTLVAEADSSASSLPDLWNRFLRHLERTPSPDRQVIVPVEALRSTIATLTATCYSRRERSQDISGSQPVLMLFDAGSLTVMGASLPDGAVRFLRRLPSEPVAGRDPSAPAVHVTVDARYLQAALQSADTAHYVRLGLPAENLHPLLVDPCLQDGTPVHPYRHAVIMPFAPSTEIATRLLSVVETMMGDESAESGAATD
jgi:hypothetical protein